MIRSIRFKALLGFGLVQAAVFVSACSGEPAVGSEAATSGTLSMPLQTNVGAHTYQLAGALQVNGPVWTVLDLAEYGEVATTSLPTGQYYAYLYGWALYRVDGDGNLLPVSAELLSTAQPSFEIYNQSTSTISFEFRTDGHVVSVGAGSLNVDIDVTEGASLCTPLGDGCPSGTWCAPSELIGREVSCVHSGPLELGAACQSPLDCGANSSCIDFGQGAVCAQLCASDQFGQPCSAGGSCTAQGIEYGVCAP